VRLLLLNLTLPRINPHMTTAVIDQIHAVVGAPLPVGGKLFDLTVDLSAAASHDCPPVAHYRLVVRDRAWLRRLDVAPGDTPEVGASLALFSTEPDEPLDAPPARQVRLTVAGVIQQSIWGEAQP
jgi:hypothetical protein